MNSGNTFFDIIAELPTPPCVFELRPIMHPAQFSESDFSQSCKFETTRRGGPGGQNRNKVETAVIAVYIPTGHRAEANEKRTQGENRVVAIFRLRLVLALEFRTKWSGSPSDCWRERLIAKKLAVSPSHVDFPGLLAEAMDALEYFDKDIPATAEKMLVSTSQLIKLLSKHPPAFAKINAERLAMGWKPLRTQ